MSKALAATQQIYAAFQRRDIACILDAVADDVAWESWSDNSAQVGGVPWLAGGTGREAVARFFGQVAQMTIHDVQVLDILASDTQAAVEFVIDATAPTSVRYRDEELHLWTFNAEGKVTRLRHYADTAKHLRAAGLLGATAPA